MTNGTPQLRMDIRPRLAEMKHLANATSDRPDRLMVEASRRRPARVNPPEHFVGRGGYDGDFLAGFTVALPAPQGARARDVTPVGADSSGRLDYQHFSVVMSASRRMAMFTAVNIEGARSVSIPREDDDWFLDGRIPIDAQLGEELYAGNRLDRGHLVRREDPNWGTAAGLANVDTFHFTNCAPQMDVFNQQTWLGLENYVLQNARAWNERCSVFTGPVFRAADLPYRGALVPRSFWKVVAFLSDDGRPSATAYVVEQDHELIGLEAAFGRYKTFQRSIRHVESLSGISFGELARFDGFSNEELALGGLSISAEINEFADIRV
nr:DNA/RNA non-specific endonuclease [Mesorhizobium sp.]